MWKKLVRALKLQHLTTLHRAYDNIVWRLSVHAPIVATPGLLKLTLALGLRIYHHDNLISVLH